MVLMVKNNLKSIIEKVNLQIPKISINNLTKYDNIN